MSNFFISYRRKDIAAKTIVRFIAKEIDLYFGNGSAFYDLRSIPSGEDFSVVLRNTLESCSAIIALIGSPDEWLGTDCQNLRIAKPDDWVRIEIETGLASGKKVVPLLIDGADMPKRQLLPPSIATFSNLQASKISTGKTFDHDLKQLTDDLERIEASLEQGDTADVKPIEESLQELWHSAKPRSSKILGTQMLCRGLAMPSLVYESFHLDINIKDPAGNSDFKWFHSGFNVTDDEIDGEAKSLWFENPQTRPISITAEANGIESPKIEILRDYANYKDFYYRFNPPVAPKSEFYYDYRYHAPEMFTQNHYWDWKSRNLTLKAGITIRHRKLKRLKYCSVEEHTSRGKIQDKQGVLQVRTENGTATLDWSIEMPKQGAIYRIYWGFFDDE